MPDYLHVSADGKLLRSSDDKLLGGDNCCCTCSYTVELTLNWSGNADLDLYGKVDSSPACYYNRLSSGGLGLNHDAHPSCAALPLQPEIMTGTFTDPHTFSLWYNQFSNCTAELSPSVNHIKITNTGGGTICVNGTNVSAGDSWESDALAYGGYNTGDISASFGGGTTITVACGGC